LNKFLRIFCKFTQLRVCTLECGEKFKIKIIVWLSFTCFDDSYFGSGGASSVHLPTLSTAYVLTLKFSPHHPPFCKLLTSFVDLFYMKSFMINLICYNFVNRKCVSEFSGAFTKLQRRLLGSSCASVRLCVRPSVHMEQLSFHRTYCHET